MDSFIRDYGKNEWVFNRGFSEEAMDLFDEVRDQLDAGTLEEEAIAQLRDRHSRYPLDLDAAILLSKVKKAQAEDGWEVPMKQALYAVLQGVPEGSDWWSRTRLNYYVMDNRPFYRLMWDYCQYLQDAGLWGECDLWAQRMVCVEGSTSGWFRRLMLLCSLKLERWEAIAWLYHRVGKDGDPAILIGSIVADVATDKPFIRVFGKLSKAVTEYSGVVLAVANDIPTRDDTELFAELSKCWRSHPSLMQAIAMLTENQ